MIERLPIAPLGYDQHWWTPTNPRIFSRSEVERQTGDYESAVTPRIQSWTPTLTASQSADLSDAEAQLRVFDEQTAAKLGGYGAELAPMSAILLRTESASSSQIERLTASARALAYAELGEGEKRNTTTILGNVRAMEAALRLSDSLTRESVLEMHHELLRDQWDMKEEAGRIRRELVWIGGRDTAGPRGASYIAPQHELVAAALDDLLAFASRSDLPSLLAIAVAHAQFETVHPFVDGNGRTGRAVAQAMMRARGLSRHMTVPLSAGILTETDAYFSALTAFRGGDAAPILTIFTNAARFASVTGTQLVDDLHHQIERDRESLRGVRSDSSVWRALPYFIGQPAVNTRYVARVLGVSLVAAHKALDTLVARKILRERTGMSRNRVWEHAPILDILDAYAASLRRVPIDLDNADGTRA